MPASGSPTRKGRRIGLAKAHRTNEVTTMAALQATTNAQASAKAVGDALEVSLGGSWQITDPRPNWTELLGAAAPARVILRTDAVERWDTSLLLFLFEVQQWCRVKGAYCDLERLPEKIRVLLGQMVTSHETSVPFDRSENFLTAVGLATQDS